MAHRNILGCENACRLVYMAVEYHCEFNLYEVIRPSECGIEVVGNEIRIGLRKETKGWWPRLTKAKQTVPFITHISCFQHFLLCMDCISEQLCYLKVDFDRALDRCESEDTSNSERESSEPKPPLSLAKGKLINDFISFFLSYIN